MTYGCELTALTAAAYYQVLEYSLMIINNTATSDVYFSLIRYTFVPLLQKYGTEYNLISERCHHTSQEFSHVISGERALLNW